MLRLPNNDRLLRLLGTNLLIGLLAAAAMTAGLVICNVGGLKTLLAADPAGLIAVGLLFFGFAVTFGSIAMGIAVWTQHSHDDDDEGGGRRSPELAQTPRLATVRAK